ncbi:hypothetical protein Ancab_010846 [Ancistrocladus abbreviatus]
MESEEERWQETLVHNFGNLMTQSRKKVRLRDTTMLVESPLLSDKSKLIQDHNARFTLLEDDSDDFFLNEVDTKLEGNNRDYLTYTASLAIERRVRPLGSRSRDSQIKQTMSIHYLVAHRYGQGVELCPWKMASRESETVPSVLVPAVRVASKDPRAKEMEGYELWMLDVGNGTFGISGLTTNSGGKSNEGRSLIQSAVISSVGEVLGATNFSKACAGHAVVGGDDFNMVLSLLDKREHIDLALRSLSWSLWFAEAHVIHLPWEVVNHMCRNKHKKGFMAIKVNLKKTYDQLSWEFVCDTLEDVGLPLAFLGFYRIESWRRYVLRVRDCSEGTTSQPTSLFYALSIVVPSNLGCGLIFPTTDKGGPGYTAKV